MQTDKKELKATRTVYCYYLPEIRKIVDKVVKEYPHKVFLSSIEPGLDNFHIPVIEKFMRFYERQVPGLKDFPFKYFTEGSRQGIFHLLVELKVKNPGEIIYLLKGEYEGYKEYAIRLGLRVMEIDENNDFSKLEPGVFFISNPSARDGNIIPNELINRICQHHRVAYDIAYLGMTKENFYDLSNKNIIAVFGSMSKPFGMYYYRAGFAFTKEPMETLIANKWFKNIFSLIVADRVLSEIKPQQFYEKYKAVQIKIIEKINKENNLKLKPSEVFLLANSENKIEPFMRNKFCRLCLTPYFLGEEKGELK